MKLLVTGGGTGGHIYPALAFLKRVREVYPEASILYIGTKKGLESKIVPKAGISFQTIDVQGLKRSFHWENLRTVYLLLKSLKKAKQLIRSFQPDVVIGTGGYVSAPVVLAATKLNVPTVIHEQNSLPGMTNKFLSNRVDKVAISFSEAGRFFPREKVIFTGNPRAQEVAELPKSTILERYGLKPELPTVVLFGGSRGALAINQAVVEALPNFAGKSYQVLYAAGERYYEEWKETFEQAEKTMENVSIVPYVYQMPEVLANVQLLVSRAGATSLAEMTALGLPGILIPSPFVTNDHQTKNAQSLVDVDAAKMISNEALTGERLVSAIEEILLDEDELRRMSTASKQQGQPDSAQRLLEVVEAMMQR